MAIVNTPTPEFITFQEYSSKKIIVNYDLPFAVLTGDIVIVADFKDAHGLVIATDASTKLVKVDADGVDSAITVGEELKGYRIGYKASADMSKGDTATGELEYWSSI